MSAILQPVSTAVSERQTRPSVRQELEVAETVKSIKPYIPTSSLTKIELKPEQVPFKLDWNESTIPPSPKVFDALSACLSGAHELNWYPELNSQRLVAKLTEYVGVDADHLLVTNGSDDALELVCKTFLNPDDEVIIPSPTYTHFLVFAGATGAKLISVYNDEPTEANLRMILQALTYETKLLYLVNPNNPTGVCYSEGEIRTILETAPHTLLIVDEAYFEFCGQTVAHLVKEYDNLIVTRTFSKSFGIAGMRVGYLITSPRIMIDLKRLFNPKSVNLFGQVAAEAALCDIEYLNDYVAQVSVAKTMIVEFLRQKGLDARETPANFILFKVRNTKRFCRLLEDEGIYARDRSSLPQMKGYIRMSVGTIDQAKEIIARFERVLERDIVAL